MNRRKFFAGIAAAVTAACVPDLRDKAISLRNVKIQFPNLRDYTYQGSVTGRWSAQHVWWCSDVGVRTLPTQDFAKLEVRTLASLQAAWKECLAYKSSDTLIVDEHTLDLITSHRSKRS